MISSILNALYLCAGFAIAQDLLRRIALWFWRIRSFKKTMPVIPALFPPDSNYRRLFPKKWQTFHQDWNMQYKRTIYHKLNSDIFALVCLFEYDKVYYCDPEAVVDMKVTKAEQFPKDMVIFSKVCLYFGRGLIEDGALRWECGYYYWGRVESTSEDYVAYILAENDATCL
jgi:hypothetical protein